MNFGLWVCQWRWQRQQLRLPGPTFNAHALWGLVVMRVVTNPQLETLSTLPWELDGNPSTCRSLENTTQTIHSVARSACYNV